VATSVDLVGEDEDEGALTEQTLAGDPVPASQAATGSQPRASTARPAPRQQPVRRPGAAKRRPSGKKKRR